MSVALSPSPPLTIPITHTFTSRSSRDAKWDTYRGINRNRQTTWLSLSLRVLVTGVSFASFLPKKTGCKHDYHGPTVTQPGGVVRPLGQVGLFLPPSLLIPMASKVWITVHMGKAPFAVLPGCLTRESGWGDMRIMPSPERAQPVHVSTCGFRALLFLAFNYLLLVSAPWSRSAHTHTLCTLVLDS
jgi:hypothetical protein